MACHSPLKLCIHVAPADYDWGEPCHPNAIMTRVLAATSWDSASSLNSCLVNEGSWRQRTIGHQSRRGARAQPQPCLTLDTAPAQQAHVNLLFKCPAITFSIGNAGEKWFCFWNPPSEQGAAWFVFLFVWSLPKRRAEGRDLERPDSQQWQPVGLQTQKYLWIFLLRRQLGSQKVNEITRITGAAMRWGWKLFGAKLPGGAAEGFDVSAPARVEMFLRLWPFQQGMRFGV